MNCLCLRLRFSLLLVLAYALTVPGLGQERSPRRTESRTDEAINFSLLDYHGRYYELRRSNARAVVLFFTGFGCPIARQSVRKLQALRRQFGEQGVAIWLVNSCPQDDPDDSVVEAFARSRRGELVPDPALNDPQVRRLAVLRAVFGSLPVLRDEMQLVAHHYGVTRTCETIVIDPKAMAIVYRGAIDDQLSEGAQKPKPAQRFLAAALDEFLAGKPVSTPTTPVHGCRITFDPGPATQPVSYRREIAPLLLQHCVSCHSPGNIGPFSMSSYKKVKGWSAMIEEVLLDRRMPPWHADPHYGKFANDRSLSSTQIRALLDWIEQDCPRGDGEDPLTNTVPAAPTWALGQPDFIVSLPEPQDIPATGTLDYRYLDADFEMPHDAWLRAAVCRADNTRVVHHIIVRVRYPEGYEDAPPESYLFTSWVPGLTQSEFPAGTGMFLPKGARLNFEMHYTTTGQAQTDRSELGLYLAKEPAQRLLEVRACETRDLDLPPGEPDIPHFCHYCFTRDTLLYALSPHMHLRGLRFNFQLLYPDGRRETLLSVPNYDFNWQTAYRLAQPKRVPAGTWMLCTGAHDNSARNPNNPDPTKRVHWGLQSWDEMFMGFMTVADASPGVPGKPVKASAAPLPFAQR